MIEITLKGETLDTIRTDVTELAKALHLVAWPEAKPREAKADTPVKAEPKLISVPDLQKRVAAFLRGNKEAKAKVASALDEIGAPKVSEIPENKRLDFLKLLGVD